MKVFRTELWVKDMIGSADMIARSILYPKNWQQDCEGKTKEECNEYGYEILDNWMEEAEQNDK